MSKNDFIKFAQSRNPLKTSYTIEKDVKSLFSPHIIEERELNITQMDVFSRLMMDRIIFFGDEVNSDTANIVVSQLLYLDSVDNEAPITMNINSPGGHVYDGLSIVDTMFHIGPKVNTVCTGMAASMGAVLLACGARGGRSALQHSRVMIHQVLGGSEGQASDMEIAVKQMPKLKQELSEILAIRSGQPIEKVINDCDRDHWMTAQEAQEYGLIDEVIKIDLNSK